MASRYIIVIESSEVNCTMKRTADAAQPLKVYLESKCSNSVNEGKDYTGGLYERIVENGVDNLHAMCLRLGRSFCEHYDRDSDRINSVR